MSFCPGGALCPMTNPTMTPAGGAVSQDPHVALPEATKNMGLGLSPVISYSLQQCFVLFRMAQRCY